MLRRPRITTAESSD